MNKKAHLFVFLRQVRLMQLRSVNNVEKIALEPFLILL